MTLRFSTLPKLPFRYYLSFLRSRDERQTMSTTVLQYPPSPSARSRNSFLSIDHHSAKRDSLVSTAASYETAFAGGASSTVSGIEHDDTFSRQSSPSVNPIHQLANSANENSAPVHIMRVSHDTVYVKSEPVEPPRLVQAGRAIASTFDHGAHMLGHKTGGVPNSNNEHHPQMKQQHPHQPALRTNGAVVEGPNGLTPPPSPPSDDSFRLAPQHILDGPTVEEPVDTISPQATPRKWSSDTYTASCKHRLL